MCMHTCVVCAVIIVCSVYQMYSTYMWIVLLYTAVQHFSLKFACNRNLLCSSYWRKCGVVIVLLAVY